MGRSFVWATLAVPLDLAAEGRVPLSRAGWRLWRGTGSAGPDGANDCCSGFPQTGESAAILRARVPPFKRRHTR